MQARYRVTLWESERGWGRRVFMDIDFEDLAAAQAKAREVNAENNLPQVPDYYVFADAPVLVDAERDPPRG